jgi:hypothetical protein
MLVLKYVQIKNKLIAMKTLKYAQSESFFQRTFPKFSRENCFSRTFMKCFCDANVFNYLMYHLNVCLWQHLKPA